MNKPGAYEQALLDPTAVFATPDAVVRDRRLSHGQKIEVLRRWEYDADELEVAEEEGMAGGEASLLRQILTALHELGAELAPGRSPPTEHDGI
jgi:hypothetical protein